MTYNRSLCNPQLLSALFYGLSSILVIFANKALLTQFDFPYFNFVATAQFILTSIFLFILSFFHIFEIPWISPSICLEILPLSLMFLGNVVTGLGSTKSLNLPMFTALRRFSIMMTMFGEWFILDNKPNSKVILSIVCMIFGAFIAAMFDLTFDLTGYSLIFANNLFTAINGVWMKKTSLSGKCTKMGIMFYNSLFSAIIMISYLTIEHQYYNTNAMSINHSRILHNHIINNNITIDNNIATKIHPISTTYHRSTPSFYNYLSLSYSDINQSNEYTHTLYDVRYLLDSIQTTTISLNNLRGTNIITKDDITKANQLLSQKHKEFDIIQQQHLIEQQQQEELMKFQSKSTVSHILAYPHWYDITFLSMFFITCIMGSILNFAIFICTTINSALTTAVIGALKNIATTYVAMIVFSDYKFTWINFMGINISTLGSFYYTYITLFKRNHSNDSNAISKI